MGWTFKTLKFGRDGAAEWLTMPYDFPVMAGAAMAAQAYLIAHGERGEMVVVSLEPSAELKPVYDRLAEHTAMLDYLKARWNGEADLRHFILNIDPDWLPPWQDPDDPEGLCTCGMQDINYDCPIHGDHYVES